MNNNNFQENWKSKEELFKAMGSILTELSV